MAGVFESVNKFFGVKEKPAPKQKSQAEEDDDNRFRNKFRDGPNDKPKSKKKKKDSSPGKKIKGAASSGLAAKLRDKSRKEIKKQGG